MTDWFVDRVVEIRARPSTVFRFFTDSERWARWWGTGSTIEPSVGGAVLIVYPNGARASGEVRELVVDERIAFTFGYEGPGKPIPPGGSLVTITVTPIPSGTRLQLRHVVGAEQIRDDHVRGWRYQLARFASVVADDVFAGAADRCAAWFTAWSADDPRSALAAIVTDDVRFRDGNGDSYGLDELVEHVTAVRRFMPGVRLEPRGVPRRSHDVAIADWAIVDPAGAVRQTGSNVVRFASDGRIADVVAVT